MLANFASFFLKFRFNEKFFGILKNFQVELKVYFSNKIRQSIREIERIGDHF